MNALIQHSKRQKKSENFCNGKSEKMGKTKKVKSAGRFRARYGVGIRKRLLKVELEQKQKHLCPSCGFKKVKRIDSGIFECKKCNTRFAGGTFLPETMSGTIVKKIISQKHFGLTTTQLLEQMGKVQEAGEQVGETPLEEKTEAKEKKEK